ncbi:MULTISPECIES: hypothetical protein [Burkholderia cepacia complex]|uniref:hypothetical protein n=1 Tax=Burkholderia cepacia complex TaxID=87882 RepID=UPI00075BF55A|nr:MULTISPECIES: hypothetical protein [Burkholderia cepacia complex]KVL50005.1 hypothetical protein WT00_18820 [Burkholderia territorii]KVZ62232.1 hypothetical protein WL19_30085 [Burkholderia ubonensis]KWE37407.1 hypothetical protein WT49_11265 [Burkholderia territorii]KWE38447.1 hypothetical protein WT50_20120 [Burkholderia territorii]KWE40326.1 hypothetical protein WT51_28015 [Burkholderia territorii]
MTTTTTIWTDDDERLLRELASRKQEVEAHQRATVEAVVSTFAFHSISEAEITDSLIDRAEQICRALVPYLPRPSEAEAATMRKKAIDAIALGLGECVRNFPASTPVVVLHNLIAKGLLPVSMKSRS